MKFRYTLEKIGSDKIRFQVLEQDKRLYNFEFRYGPIFIETASFPNLEGTTIYLRGANHDRDNEVSITGYSSPKRRDEFFTWYKEALEEFSLKVNDRLKVNFPDSFWVPEDKS